MAPLGYDIFRRVRNLEKDLRSSRAEEERLQAELQTALEDKKKLGATLKEQEEMLEKKEVERVAAVADHDSAQICGLADDSGKNNGAEVG